jgi:Ca2+-transporting ATPase
MRLLTGLTEKEVQVRRSISGWNEISLEGKPAIQKLIWRQINQPLVWLLLFASLLSFGFGEETSEPISIIAILVVNIFIGVFQENKAENALQALKQYTVPTAKVLRAKELTAIPTREIVSDDLIFLEAGDLVPADGMVLESYELQVNEAIITGESLPVIQPQKLKSGTSLVKGTAWLQVEKTGLQTELGQTANLLRNSVRPEVPLQNRLRKLGFQILIICLALVLITGGLCFYRGMTWLEVFFFSISLMVATVPEGLPVIVSLALALGVQRMAKKMVLVRQLSAIETLGGVSVICTDKTGTLTYGEMRLTHFKSEDPARLFTAAVSCLDADLHFENGVEKAVGDPMEIAILRYAMEHFKISKAQIESLNQRIAVEPFDSETMQMRVTRQSGTTYIKGAFEKLSQNLSTEGRKYWLSTLDELTQEGLRVLAVAEISKENKFEFKGLLGFSDPPRVEAEEAVRLATSAGIHTIMITGDHESTARAIAKQLGIREFYARVTASKKLELVKNLVQQGNVVAMTGDGVNDAPALKEAHVGIAMGKSGTEVTKESAHVVLTDDNFSHIVSAVREGRGIFENIRKSVIYLLTGNFGELCLIFFASLFAMPVPLLASQLLWINLVTDGVPALILVSEPTSVDVMKKKPRQLTEALLGKKEWVRILGVGFLEAIICLFVFYQALPQGLLKARTVCFMTLVVSEIFRIFASLNPRLRESSVFRASVMAIVTTLVQFGLCRFEWSQSALSLTWLSIKDIQSIFGYGLIVPVIIFMTNQIQAKIFSKTIGS